VIRIYRALITQQFQVMSAYRVSLFLYALFSFIRPIIFLAAWIAVADSQGGRLGALTKADLAGYYVITIVVTHLTAAWDFFEFEWEIRRGTLSPKLLRPLHPLNYSIVNNVLWKLMTSVAVIPVAVLIGITFDARFTTQPWHIAVGLPSVLLSAALTFVFGWVFASVAFWTTRVHAVVTLYQRAAFIFSGQVAPLTLLPGPLLAVAFALPFGYMLGVPAEILRGGPDLSTALLMVAGQVVWLAIGIVLYRVVWNAGLRQYSAVGA
jgi:ABC-2 type transport system permease protein